MHCGKKISEGLFTPSMPFMRLSVHAVRECQFTPFMVRSTCVDAYMMLITTLMLEFFVMQIKLIPHILLFTTEFSQAEEDNLSCLGCFVKHIGTVMICRSSCHF